MKGIKKVWRESASLLLLSKTPQNQFKPSAYNYDVLVMKRSAGSKFMPNAIVFPGGVMEKSDYSRNWLDLFSSLGVDQPRLNSLKSARNTDFIYQRSSEDEQLERELSLRITAIRETFEEVGVLLAKSQDDFKRDSTGLYSSALSGFDIQFWQKEVQSNPNRFYDLCKELQVVPDVFSLQGWSNWLTPTAMGKHRFDTIFFVACLKDRPDFEMDEKEAQSVMWSNPGDLVELNKSESIWLPPPQNYELSKLCNVKDFDHLATYSKWRNQFGTTLYFPAQYSTKGQLLIVLPGDDMYPKEPNYMEKNEDYSNYADKTVDELRVGAKNLHRFEQNQFKATLFMNINPQNEHLCPQGIANTLEDFKVKAKL